MNAVSDPKTALVTTNIDDTALITVLQNSLYPGARPESIKLVLAWCRATGRDPMKKPIHIVPMNVKNQVTGRYEWRDTLMPGIGTYRSDAASTGAYAGKSDPEFGPDVTTEFAGEGGRKIHVTHPQWCKVTVQRYVRDQIRDFTAREFWLENYASAGRDTEVPNSMWRKRPYGQLAKCAESQALRMAFPDETGNTNTAEEMEGKSFTNTIDAEPITQTSQVDAEPDYDPKMLRFAEDTVRVLDAAKTLKSRAKIIDEIKDSLPALHQEAPELGERVTEAIRRSGERLQAAAPEANRKEFAADPDKPKPPPEAEPEPFEQFLIDEFGELTTNAAGESNPLTSPMVWAGAFAAEAAKTTNIEALREHNADAIGEAGRDPNAAQVIQAAIQAATQRLAKKAPKAKPEAATALQPIAMPLTPGKKPHWPQYLEVAKAAIAQIASLDAISEWRKINEPQYGKSPVLAGVERALKDRMLQIDPTQDPDLRWVEESLAWINDPANSYETILKWAMGAIPQAKMPFLKAERFELYERVRDAIDARKATA